MDQGEDEQQQVHCVNCRGVKSKHIVVVPHKAGEVIDYRRIPYPSPVQKDVGNRADREYSYQCGSQNQPVGFLEGSLSSAGLELFGTHLHLSEQLIRKIEAAEFLGTAVFAGKRFQHCQQLGVDLGVLIPLQKTE